MRVIGIAAAALLVATGCGKSKDEGDAAGAKTAGEPAAKAEKMPEKPAEPPKPPERPSGSWATLPELPRTMRAPAAVALQDGRALVFGDGTDPIGAIWDPEKKAWAATGKGRFPRGEPAAAVLGDGRVLLTGGVNEPKGFYVLRSVDVFEPKSGKVVRGPVLTEQRRGHSATVLSDGRVLVIGGDPGGLAKPHASMEIYDPKDGKWRGAGRLQLPRSGHAAARLKDDRVLVVGGRAGDEVLDSAELCDVKTGNCKLLPLPGKRDGATATTLEDGRVLLVGGLPPGATGNSEMVFDPDGEKLGTMPPTDIVRAHHSATLLADGRVLVVGGTGKTGPHDAEIFDPARRAWQRAGEPSTRRQQHAAVRLKDGSVLIAGGLDAEERPVKAVDLWRPPAQD